MRKLLRRLTIRGLTVLVRSVGRLLPKQPNLVVFGAMKGDYYGDNSRHLFEWMLQNCPEVRPVWVTHSEKVHDDLRRRCLPVRKTRSPQGIFTMLRASAGVFTNSLRDIAAYPDMVPDSIKLVALRHGRSVKRVRFARSEHKIDDAEARSRRREANLTRYAISTSEFISDIQEECLQIGRDKHVVTGYPRNDSLLDVPEPHRRDWERYLNDASKHRVVLYAPTWRHGREATRFFPFDDFDEGKLMAALESNRTYLLLRPHVRDLEAYPGLRRRLAQLARHHRIHLATHEEFSDVNSFLSFVDVLVTDYSALYHDFLLLGRPMVFVPYDYDDFARQNGFLYDYFKNLPGPAVNTFGEFVDEMVKTLDGSDGYEDKRANLAEMVHAYSDARSNMRVASLLSGLIDTE